MKNAAEQILSSRISVGHAFSRLAIKLLHFRTLIYTTQYFVSIFFFIRNSVKKLELNVCIVVIPDLR